MAFKKIFGEEKNKSIPISFLNAVFNLTEGETIVDLDFITTIQSPEIEARKESTVDVIVSDQSGCKYIIEMQVAKIEGFEKRAQYYAAKAYCSNFNSGSPYKELKKIVFLAITVYTLFPNKDEYKSDHVILDNKTYERDLKDFSFTFVELPKFTKTIEELETLEEKWYYFLKHAEESNTIDQKLAADPEIKKAYDVVDRFHWTEQELLAYDRIAMAIADQLGALAASRNEGIQENKLQTALNLLKDNIPMENVVKWTGLSLEEVKNISLNLNKLL